MAGCNCNDDECDLDTEKVMEGIEKLQIEEGDILILRGISQTNVMQLGPILEPILQEKNARAIGLGEGMGIEKVDKASLDQLGLTYVDNTHHTESSVMRELNKEWLGAARTWIQHNFRNGDSVTWGSENTLQPEVTVRMLEEICAAAVAADRNHRKI